MASFKLLKLLCDQATRTTTVSGLSDLYYGDSIKLYLHGLPDLDITTVAATLFSTSSPPGLLAQTLAAGFSAVTDKPEDWYCTLDLLTDEIKDLFVAQTPGDPQSTHLTITDDNGTFIDVELPLYHSPHFAEENLAPIVGDPYVTESELAAELLAYLKIVDSIDKDDLQTAMLLVQAMPTLTPAQSEARVTALISALVTATA